MATRPQWINANPLQKDAASAKATVTQTAANALLTWQSFDLNKGETLVFDQQGHADWTVLNRIVAGPRGADGSRFVASPSTILGSIEAPGSVYVIKSQWRDVRPDGAGQCAFLHRLGARCRRPDHDPGRAQ